MELSFVILFHCIWLNSNEKVLRLETRFDLFRVRKVARARIWVEIGLGLGLR